MTGFSVRHLVPLYSQRSYPSGTGGSGGNPGGSCGSLGIRAVLVSSASMMDFARAMQSAILSAAVLILMVIFIVGGGGAGDRTPLGWLGCVALQNNSAGIAWSVDSPHANRCAKPSILRSWSNALIDGNAFSVNISSMLGVFGSHVHSDKL